MYVNMHSCESRVLVQMTTTCGFAGCQFAMTSVEAWGDASLGTLPSKQFALAPLLLINVLLLTGCIHRPEHVVSSAPSPAERRLFASGLSGNVYWSLVVRC